MQIQGNIVLFVFLISGLLLLFACLLVTMLFLHKKSQDISRQQMLALQYQTERHLLSAKIEVQEMTFRDISREIHDGINLSLTLAHLYLRSFKWGKEENDAKRLTDATQIVHDAICQLRDLSQDLSSEILNSKGLVFAVEHEIDRIRKTNMFDVELAISEETAYLDAKKELIIFRIIQEAFNNIIRHSKASKASLFLAFSGRNVHIRIIDDGIGFNTKEFPSGKSGNGLTNIRQRTAFLNATFDIQSYVGKGTEININIPNKI